MAAWGYSEIKQSFRETYTDELKEGKSEIWAKEKWKLIKMHVGEGRRALKGEETQEYGHCISGQETIQNSIPGFVKRI